MDKDRSCSKRPVVFAILGGSLLIAIGLAVGVAVGLRDDYNNNNNNNNNNNSNKNGFKSPTGIYNYAAVVADSKVSSAIGAEILARKRGNAVDAAVATQFAVGLLNTHSCGIGGGSFFLIYDSERGEWHAADSRGTAPAAATENMFKENIQGSIDGGLASVVPGEVLGLWEIHRRFGKLPWAEVVTPSISLCDEGVPLREALYRSLAFEVNSTEDFKQEFAPYFDHNGNIKPVGSLIKLPKLAQTFRAIAEDPASFYNGSLAQDIVNDLQDEGGIMTVEDLKNYRVNWKKPTMLQLRGGFTLYSIPAPGSGPVLSYILNILAGYNMSPSDVATKEAEILTYHRIVEAFKFAYAGRAVLGDEDFVDVSQVVKNMTSLEFGEAIRARIDDSRTHTTQYYLMQQAANENDHGTSHLSVLDGQGNAVAATSTINTHLGSKIKGKRTGIVFNNLMNDFSVPREANHFELPPSPSNYIRPGKRPMSSMSPAIIWDENNKKVRMVTGASGGTKITSAVAMNIADVLWLGRSLPESIDRSRLHHQLIPSSLQLDVDFPLDFEEGLKAKGHEMTPMKGISVIQAIDVQENGTLVATADFRKGGAPAGF